MKKVLILSLATVALFSCKKEVTEPVHEHETAAPEVEVPAVEVETPETTADETAVVDGVVKLEISGDDMMKYDKAELKVPVGSKVELTLKHTGKLPAKSMGHNWTLLKQGTDIKAFAMEALNAADTNYVPEGADAVIVHTDLIGGGESTTITFDAPEKGTYDYICTFPGHYGSMQGKFIVE